MKVRLSFTFKILLPYLVLTLIFFLIFLGVFRKGYPGIVSLSLAGMVGSLLFGIIHLYWLKKPLRRISRLVTQLTRGSFPSFVATKSRDEIGKLERSLEQHVSNLKDIAAFSRSMARGNFTENYEKLSSEDAPSSILLVPVILDQQVLGVMELASLGEMPGHQIDFIRQLADALATTLAKVKANLQNRRLFEQTKKQAEALASQEKVFKENMVQLEKALESSLAKEAELQKEIEKLRKGLS